MQTAFELPILRRIDHKDLDAINVAVADGFDFISTLHSYELDIPELRSDICIKRARAEHLEGVVRAGLSELRCSRLYADPKVPFEVTQKGYEERIGSAFETSTVFVAVHDREVVRNRDLIGSVIGFCWLVMSA